MRPFEEYLDLIRNRPELFDNPPEEGVIKVITDPERIQALVKEKKTELRSEGKPEEWIDIGILVDDPWFLVVRDMVEFPGGKTGGYIRFINRKHVEGGVGAVIMVVRGDKILLLRHFRHDDRRFHWEFPRGFGEPGLTAEENARKELREELGVGIQQLNQLGTTQTMLTDTGVAYFVAHIDSELPLNPETGEGIGAVVFHTTAAIQQMVMTGVISDIFTIKCLYLAQLRGLA
jgi:ADP-ribose pyrophosphatase